MPDVVLDLAFGLLAVALFGGVVLAMTMTLLKAKYVLFALGLLAAVLVFPTVPARGPESSAAGLVPLIWIVAASRLAWPHSVWARWMYDERSAALAAARHSRPAPTGPVPARPRPPRVATLACWLLVAGLVVGGSAVSVWTFLAGVLLPFAILTRAGWATGRTVTAVLAGLGLVFVVLQLVSGAAVGGRAVQVLLGTALLGSAVLTFYRPDVTAYLRTRP